MLGGVKMAAGNSKGFSLAEVLIAIVLVGLSITALVMATNSFTMANGAGADLSTAEFLIEQIRELTMLLPVSDPDSALWDRFGPEESTLGGYDDVDDFNDVTFSPPINAAKVTLNDLAAFSQRVTVESVNRSNFDIPADYHDSDFVRVTVEVLQNGAVIASTSWIRARY
jgi:prepilin-type N-terminal cleavage/methylation domain-containing protein